jgi:allophanate hydrolase subunit 1
MKGVATVAQTKKANREAYDKKTYREIKVRVRRNSDLCASIENTLQTKGASLNHIITKLLATHYGVPMPDPHLDNM